MQNDFDAIRADIARIPGTPEGDQIIARMINGQDPIKRLLASLEANRRARTRQQAKTPQMQQGRPPVAQEKAQQLLASGIGSLPVSEDMYSPRTMAGGGIVAFEDGGEVKHFDTGGVSRFGKFWSEFTAPTERSIEYDEKNRRYQELMKAYRDQPWLFEKVSPETLTEAQNRIDTAATAFKQPSSSIRGKSPSTDETIAFMGDVPAVVSSPSAANPAKPNAAKPPVSSGKPPAEAPVDPLAAYEAYLKGDAGADKDAKREALNMFGVEAGLNILAGDSPYALQNIGQAQKAARGYGERLAELRKDQRARAKELAEFGLTKAKMAQDKELAELYRKTQKEVASIAASARGDSGEKLNANIIKGATAAVDKKLGLDREYFKLKTAAEKAAYRKKLIQEELGLYGVELPGAAGNTWAGWSQVG